mgnify:CR=1 FL=1
MGSGAAITRLKTCCWASVEALIAKERDESHIYGGRSVFGIEPSRIIPRARMG